MFFGPQISVGRRGVSYGDSDAQAFISATGLTGTTEVNAVTNLVANLKSYGLWSKMKAIYPFVSDQVNLSSYTEVFTNAAWGKDNSSTSDNQTTAPNGTTTAAKLIESATSNQHLIYQATNAIVSNVYTFSCYLKSNDRSVVAIQLADSSASVKRYTVLFDLSNGTVVTTRSSNTPTSTNNSITSIGSGWYRCSVTMAQGSGNTMYSHIALSNSTSPTWNTVDFPTYLGDGVKSVYIWGAQLELGSTATTYQKTSTTASSVFVQQFKYNLKDPRDLDAAFRLSFNGTWTYAKTGATPNGVNGYANSYLNPVANGLTSASSHLSYYARTAATTGDPAEIANYTNGSEAFVLQSKSNGLANRFFFSTGNAATRSVVTAPIGYMGGSAVANTRRDLYLNGVSVANNTTTDTSTLGNYNLYLAAGNIGGSSIASYSNSETAFATIGNGLTSTEMANLYTTVQTFQTSLARYVGVPIVSDSNAQAFLDAAVITDQTQANAINTLVTDLKGYGIWTKMKAIYPFVGGTATTHKWNLKDPRDLDAAYRLAFSGAWTHSSTGALPNGANAYADTFFNQQGSWTSTSNGAMGLYLRTNSVGNYCDMGAGTISSGANSSIIFARYTGDVIYSGLNCSAVTPGSANTNSQGFHAVSRTNTSSYSRYKRGSSTINVTNTDAIGTNVNRNIYLGAGNDTVIPLNYSNREIAFSFLGDGLTQSEIDLYYTAVNKFETSLSRNV